MGKDSLDKHFKDLLHDHKTPTDPEKIWMNIKNVRKTPRAGNRRLLWIIPILLLTITVISYGYFNQTSSVPAPTDVAQKDVSIEQNFIENKKSNQSQESLTQNDINETAASAVRNLKTVEDSNIQDVQEADFSSAIKLNKSKSNRNITHKQDQISDINKTRPVTTASKSEVQSSADKSSDDIQLTQTTNKANESLNTQNQISNESVQAETMLTNLAESNLEDITSGNKANIAAVKKGLNLTSEISFLDKQPSFIEYLSIKTPTFTNSSAITPFYNGSKDWEFSLGAYGAYGLTEKKLSLSQEPGDTDYLSARKQSESSLEAIGFGFDIKASKWNSFYLKGGIEYNQVNEKFEITESRDSSYIDDNQVIRIIVNSNGDSIPEYGPALVTETYFFQKKIHNYYRFIDFPVVGGFEYKGTALNYFAEAGVSVNLVTSLKGEVYDDSLLPYSLSQDDRKLFKTNAGLSIIGGFGLSYHFTDRLSLSANTRIKYMMGSITSTDNPIDQSYISVGFQAGLRYNLSY